MLYGQVSHARLAIFLFSPLFDGVPSATRWLVFVVAEHAMLFIKETLADIVPDVPRAVQSMADRHEHIVHKVFVGVEDDSNDTLHELVFGGDDGVEECHGAAGGRSQGGAGDQAGGL